MKPDANHPAPARKCYSLLFATLAAVLFTMPASAEPSLYDRLGGPDGVQRLVHELIEVSSTAPVTRRSFAKFNRPRLENLLQQQICKLSGGGCLYEGDGMRESHEGLDITEAEFYGMVAHLRAVCDRQGIDQKSKNELLVLLAPMKRDIVSGNPVQNPDQQK
jgi:hemoglobin